MEWRGQATFLPDDPPRAGVLAVAEPFARGTADLVVATADGPRRQTVAVSRYGVREAVANLVDGNAASPSARFWCAAATWALTLVARGRLQPAVTDGGWDAWRIGPLDAEDAERLAALVAACPPEAHAIAVPGTRPLRMRSAAAVVREFCDAVADTMVRTAAAPLTAEGQAYAATARTDAGHLKPWLEDNSRGLSGARAGLRIEERDEETLVAVIQLRGRDDPSLVVDAADLWTSPAAVLDRLGPNAENDLLLALRRGARAWPPLGRALATKAPSEVTLDDDAIADLLGDGAEALNAAGLEVLWPKELLLDGVTVRAVAATPSLDSEGGKGFSLDEVLQFRWEARVGGELLTDAELAELAEAKRPLVRLRGRWLKVDAALIERLRRRRPQRIGAMEALAASLTGRIVVEDEVVEFEAHGGVADLARTLADLAGSRDTLVVDPPEGLTATLRPYQLRGLRWLAQMTQLGLGGCLADDMGLGKTVQLIALHLLRRPSRPTLVVCPTSLLGNWEREVARFAPDVPVRRFHGGERHLAGLRDDEIVLATYGMVRRDRAALAEVRWGLAVADEAQHVKNPLSRGARELRAIPADARVALTGTPVENRLTDLWAILDWTTPGLLGPLDRFRRSVAVPVERYHDPEATERLARVVRPFLLRRRKSDPGIAPELPPKIETDRVVPLTAEQATLYQAVVAEALESIASKAGIERRGLVLKLLTELKQICNHPAQYLHQDGPLPGRSGKLAALDELADVIVDEGDAVLVFSQYVAMGHLLEAHLNARGVGTLFLHGAVPVRRREEMVTRFQAGDVPVFLLSLKAGGTGLNLTRATHVIHYDRWWNPAVEDQATDRAYRIGQDRAVQVHRLIAEGTLEDRIAAVMAAKRDLAESVVGTGEAWLTELSDAELAELVSLA
ncbi:MAG TPA: DEAD/DEAH box helicase [Mycobacteriales bacterium]|jgi:superfamily II DNA or RNA helicase|nr:DEAD/DEAH box helicase [Mycobacteriales bacterium]